MNIEARSQNPMPEPATEALSEKVIVSPKVMDVITNAVAFRTNIRNPKPGTPVWTNEARLLIENSLINIFGQIEKKDGKTIWSDVSTQNEEERLKEKGQRERSITRLFIQYEDKRIEVETPKELYKEKKEGGFGYKQSSSTLAIRNSVKSALAYLQWGVTNEEGLKKSKPRR